MPRFTQHQLLTLAMTVGCKTDIDMQNLGYDFVELAGKIWERKKRSIRGSRVKLTDSVLPHLPVKLKGNLCVSRLRNS